MKNFLKNGGLVLAGLVASISAAHATLPTAATGAFNTLKDDVLSLVDLAWVAAVPITVAFIILRMFKRAASSAT